MWEGLGGQIVGRTAVKEDHAVFADLVHCQCGKSLFGVRPEIDAVFETAEFRIRFNRAAMYALDMLRRMALGLPVPDSRAITPDTPATTMDI